MKKASNIVKWGKIKAYFDKSYNFNTIDIETVKNELFLFGYTKNGKYYYTLNNFYNNFHDFLINSIQEKRDVLTWSRYDNTHLVKLIFSKVSDTSFISMCMLRIGKISPIFEYKYKNFTIVLENIIKDSMLFKIIDNYGNSRRITIYNLKNLYTSDLETTAKNYKIDYYSKLGIEYHIIDEDRFNTDNEYRKNCLLSNELDNRVLLDIANNFLESFKSVTGVYPKSIFTAGSIARSFILAKRDELDVKSLNFKYIFGKNKYHDELLEYSMNAYHGGKIESYCLGYIKEAKIIDITSAYPYALSIMPKLTNKVTKIDGDIDKKLLNNYFYAFINCDVYIEDINFIHPLIIRSPINKTNLSPYGYLRDIVITKWEYDYLIENNIKVDIKSTILIKHDDNVFPYKNLVDFLFNSRMENKKKNPSLSDLFKTIINSLYGITFELIDLYDEIDDEIEWVGYRAGDFFNPVIASYITAIIRTYLSKVSYNIISNSGEVYLNMTDSIIYNGEITLDVFSKRKTLGKFEEPEIIKDVIILGAGRYEYKNTLNKYIIKNRGFSVSNNENSFYSRFNLNNEFTIKNKTFVSTFRSTTKKYSYKELGYILDDDYTINPFNLGGKRLIKEVDKNKNLNKTFIKTYPVYLDKYIYK